jgi:hypothetical protein
MDYESMTDFGRAGDAWMADDEARRLTETVRADSPFAPSSAGLYTEVTLF